MVAIDIHDHFRAGDLEVAVDVHQSGYFLQALFEFSRRLIQFVQILGLKGVLIQTTALLAADADQRRIGQIGSHPQNRVQLGAQLIDDLFRRQFPLGPRLQPHEDPAGVGAVVSTGGVHGGEDSLHVRIGLHDRGRFGLRFHHGLEGGILRQLRGALDLARILVGNESGGDHAIKEYGGHQRSQATIRVMKRCRTTRRKVQP